ncbi:MAG: 3-oxoacyl-ACP reductase FabG, partial [Hyphomicrobiaceae bacterium]|nr:3-oxoacyl-ACP reductase FabG [Hyphomicrobiaceae bacterium]
MFDLSGKTALVTGATGGIGGAIVDALVDGGARVVATGTRAEALAALTDRHGDKVVALTANLSDAAAVDGLVARAEEAAGAPVDILVNNAGITRDQLFMRMKDEDWEQVLTVNLTAAFRLSRAVLKGMMKRRYGRIVQITSVVGTTGNPGQGNYVAAKAGLTGMSKALAQEVASRNITVNCVAPGFIETPMTDALNEKQREGILANVPAGRLGSGGDVAAA